jgi:serine/threonine-protein kinase
VNSLQPGATIGPYRLIHELGRGGMAVVWKAYHAAMDRHVAIKVMPYQFAQREEFIKRFRQEVRLIARLEHPHILPVYDYGESEDLPYLVMRFLDAGTLTDRIRLKKLSLAEIDRIFTQLAEALAYAHEQGVIHRDIKPSNVMLDQRGTVFLTDFGIAKLVEGATQLTATGTITGTPEYMSPEQAQGFPLDQRTDIYSLGVVLYEMLTDEVPFHAETPVAVLLKKIQDTLPPPTLLNPNIPDRLEPVLLKGLAKNPDDRYHTMGDFLAAWKRAYAESQDRLPTHQAAQPVFPTQGRQAAVSPASKPAPVSQPAQGRQPTQAPVRLSQPALTPVPGASQAPKNRVLMGLLLGAGAVSVLCILVVGGLLARRLLENRSQPTEKYIVAAAPASTTTPVRPQPTAAQEQPVLVEPERPTNAPEPTRALAPTQAPAATRTPEPTQPPPTAAPTRVSLPERIVDSYGIDMALVPAGEFSMGSNMDRVMAICPGLYRGSACDLLKFKNEAGEHTVYLDSFYIDQYEVTNAQYAECVRQGSCRRPEDASSNTRSLYYGDPTFDNYPVIYITWSDARTYCQWRGARLPTEAEWEKAARGTDGRFYPWGNDFDGTQANSCDRNCNEPRSIETFDDGYADTSPVGWYANGQSVYGVFDLAGNVWEWTADWLDPNYYASLTSTVRNPLGPASGEERVLRGGSWLSDAFNLRSALRYSYRPALSSYHIGFRCAKLP